jgi:CheY-like chemotaxis protein/two-component sensor histidine kinase
VIVRNARSQSKLIEDLLDASRISRGELRLDMQPLEILPIIKSAIELAASAAEAKEISITEGLEPTANFITGDADRMNQILDNLLSNAIKFTPQSGTVEVRLERDNNEAKIIVTDSGQGISEDFLPQIFRRFKQADPSETRRHGGLGIGLSLARHLVELHGGRISAQSAGEGTGATFTVYLPLRTIAPIKQNPDGNGAESMNNQGKLSGVWVLAVDDEADAREMVSFMLQINGAKVTSARSAVEALDILRNSGERIPDLLLSDISMPNESGYALLEKIRALPQENGGQIPAIALTAFNRPEDRQAALEAGFQKHLGKPVEPDNLILAIIETAAMK